MNSSLEVQPKTGGIIILVFVGFALVIGAITGIVNVINPHPTPAATPLTASLDKPMVERTWNASFEGLHVSCGVVGDSRWQIMFPSREERLEGAEPLIDRAPTDDVWVKACGPADPG